jgi:hypothetical protein
VRVYTLIGWTDNGKQNELYHRTANIQDAALRFFVFMHVHHVLELSIAVLELSIVVHIVPELKEIFGNLKALSNVLGCGVAKDHRKLGFQNRESRKKLFQALSGASAKGKP